MDQDEVKSKLEYGIRHMEFAAELYEIQMNNNLYFLHEHPASATSWQLPCIKRLIERDDVYQGTIDMCQYGMVSKDGEPIKKPTSFITNSWEIAKRLRLRCNKRHNHAWLCGSKATAAAAIYPRPLCESIVHGLMDQIRVDGRANTEQD